MKAVVYRGPKQVAVADVEDAKIEQAADCIVKVSSSGVCRDDLRIYRGQRFADRAPVLGHEIIGVVEQIGPAVASIQGGDRVVLPFNMACGFCFNCVRGYPSACLTTTSAQSVSTLPGEEGAGGYGHVVPGPYRGGQAEYVRVPYADYNCVKLPGEAGDDGENDYLLLSDIFPTAYFGTELAAVRPGSSVAVFGAGPVGLLAAYCSVLRGAGEVFVVDYIPERLEKAEEIGALPIDFSEGDPVGQIMDLRQNDTSITAAMRPGEEMMAGVMCGIDAVGHEAVDRENPEQARPAQVLEDLTRLVNPTGSLGIIGMYPPQDPGAPNEPAKQGRLELPFGRMWSKGLKVGMGTTPVRRYAEYLRDLISLGVAEPSFVISHDMPLTEAPRAYDKLSRHAEGFTKVVLKPEKMAA